MGQPITDYAAFFASAGQAVQELEALNTEVEQLEADEKKLESSLKGKQRSVTETISQTVKQRKEEITKSYDAELGKAQERLKKVKAKREKAKNQGVKERIEEDTRGLVRENKELADQIKTLFKANHVPGFCRGNYYYALFQLFHDHAVAVGGDGNKVRLTGFECVQRAEIGGALNDDHIALIAEHARGIVQTLLRAGGHEDVISSGFDVELRFHAVSNLLTEVLKTVGAGVLERDFALLLKDSIGRSLDLVNGEELGCGHTACKRKNLRLVGKRQQLTDRGTLEKVHSTGKPYHF